MYNEKIVYNSTTDKWVYADVKNTKYWPNEISNTNSADDDQNNDSANDPAKGSGTHGGNVSFFAYAPYATEEAIVTTADIDGQTVTNYDGTTSGIVALSTNSFNGGKEDATEDNEKYRYSDPYVKYTISADHSKQVDLLWGTANYSSENVINEATQNGVAANTYADKDNGGNDFATRPTFNVNADLTKQKTTGTVKFLFKHALAKIGGSYRQISDYTDGSDDDASSPTNGLMVVLDIDKDGKETGGSMQDYVAKNDLEDGSKAADNKYNTKVTINEITINSEKQLTAAGRTAIETNNTIEETTTYFEPLVSAGILNLATGVWSNLSKETPVSRTQTIQSSGTQVGGVDDALDQKKDAVLATEIAEPATHPDYTKTGFEKLPIGVTTVPKNVYESEAQPFVFIPGSMPVITISIDYTVRTYDAKLAKYYSEVRQKITKRLYILDEIQMNKQYSVLMRLGLTSVKLEATVDNWDYDNEENVSGKTDGTSATSDVLTVDQTVEHVYLPINVAQLTGVTAATSANQTFAWNVTSIQNIGAVTLTYSDGTIRTTNEKVGGTSTNKDELLMPTITATSSNSKCTITKHEESGKWDGTWDIQWTGKNLGTTTRSSTITFTYGHQTISLNSTQGVGPLQVTAPNGNFAATGVTNDYTNFVVTAANGEGEIVSSYTYSCDDTWVTDATTPTTGITLQDNTGAERTSGTITVRKDEAVGTISSITQAAP